MKSLRLTLIALLYISLCLAKEEAIGFLTKVHGKVLVLRGADTTGLKAKNKMKIFHANTIQTLKGGKARLILKNGAIVNIAENTFFELPPDEGTTSKQSSSIKLFYGKLRSIVSSEKDRKFEIKTPAAVMGVRGTDFYATFKRNFKKHTSTTTLYTINGKVAFRNINTPQEKAIIVPAGKYSLVESTSKGNIKEPEPPQKISLSSLRKLEEDMLEITNLEIKRSIKKNSYLSLLDESIHTNASSLKRENIIPSTRADEFHFSDNLQEPTSSIVPENIATEKVTEKELSAIQSPIKQVDTNEQKEEEDTNNKELIQVKQNISINDSDKTVAMTKKDNSYKNKAVEKILAEKFNIETWSKQKGWKIILEKLSSKDENSLVRFVRHKDISRENKKKFRPTTLDAVFYDKPKSSLKITINKEVKKIPSRRIDEENKFQGTELEFIVPPGSYIVAIENGPAIPLTIEKGKDITIKTSALISPNSTYSIYNPLTKSFISFRSKGNPIFLLPGKYKIGKKIFTKKGIFTGKTQYKTINVKENELITPNF